MLLRAVFFPLALFLFCSPSLHAEDSADGWARLTGEVVDVTENSFTLDYGRGNLSVEVEGWHWFSKQPAELRGMRVHVAGSLEGEANDVSMRLQAIYLPELHTCHYSNAEAASALAQINDIRKSKEMILNGKVTSIDEGEFVLDAGGKKATVDTGSLLYNPTDDVGYQQLKVGDRVSVSAAVDLEFFKNGRIDAKRLITLKADLAAPN